MLKKLSIFMLSVLCFSFSASAEEAVLSFDTILNVQKDGSVNVTETLKVRHEGKQIKRGFLSFSFFNKLYSTFIHFLEII